MPSGFEVMTEGMISLAKVLSQLGTSTGPAVLAVGTQARAFFEHVSEHHSPSPFECSSLWAVSVMGDVLPAPCSSPNWEFLEEISSQEEKQGKGTGCQAGPRRQGGTRGDWAWLQPGCWGCSQPCWCSAAGSWAETSNRRGRGFVFVGIQIQSPRSRHVWRTRLTAVPHAALSAPALWQPAGAGAGWQTVWQAGNQRLLSGAVPGP